MELKVPHFFFHYHTPDVISRDDMGCHFKTLELAYLDAYRSMVEIGAELLKAHRDPSGHWIEISDPDGRSLMALYFDDVFRPKRPKSEFIAEAELFRVRANRFRRLREDIADACVSARALVDRAHEALRRARANID